MKIKKLAWLTVGFTYLLMVWGNLVSSTGSGLACPDWPLCHGTILPPISFSVVMEWGHRLLAFTASMLILATLISVFRAPLAPNSSLKTSGKTLLFLLVLQILLGATTVMLGLSPTVSTIHLMVATLVFSGLILVACVATWENPVISNPSPKVKRLALSGLVALLIQFALGALVRHSHSGLACPNFPNCLSGFFPAPWTYENSLAFIHRWWGVMMIGVFFHLATATPRHAPELARAARSAFGISIAQVLLGIGTVMSGLNTHSRATHAAVGYALWGILFYITVRAGGLQGLWKRQEAAAPIPSV